MERLGYMNICQFNIALSVFSILICACVFLYEHNRDNDKKKATGYFYGLCGTNIMVAVLYVVAFLVQNMEVDSRLLICSVVWFLYYVFYSLEMLCYSGYVLAYLEEHLEQKVNRIWLRICLASGMLFILLILINSRTHWIYNLQDSGFQPGPYYFLLNVPKGIIMAVCIYVLLSNIRAFSKFEIAIWNCYIVIPFLSSIVRGIVKNMQLGIPNASPNVTLVILLVLLVLQTDRRKELMRANEAKDAFLANMSHEIRTPINSVIGMNEMIIRENTSDQIARYAENSKEAAISLLRIINNVLDISKIASGNMKVISVNYDFRKMLVKLLHSYEDKIEEKGIQLRVEVDSNLPIFLLGDEIKVRQCIDSLLFYVLQFIVDGAITVSVFGSRKYDILTLDIAVEGTGIEINEEEMPEFVPKVAGTQNTDTKRKNGRDLELELAKKLLELMGSELKVGGHNGTRMEFSIQQTALLKNEKMGSVDKLLSKERKKKFDNKMFLAPNAKVLVVDDNMMNRRVLRGLLKRNQVQVEEADSGKVCLQIVREEKFHLIFLDHMMPEMDGIETLEAFRKQEINKSKDTPVIMLTANAMEGAGAEYIEKGFDGFLAKPIEPGKIDRILWEFLPRDLIKTVVDKTPKEDKKVIEDVLPELPAFDMDYAEKHVGSKKLVKMALQQFYHSSEISINKLEMYLRDVSKEDARKNYCVEVHGLKSTAAMVGNLTISNLARVLEAAAKNGDVDRIQCLHPIMAEELEKNREQLKKILE